MLDFSRAPLSSNHDLLPFLILILLQTTLRRSYRFDLSVNLIKNLWVFKSLIIVFHLKR